MILKISNYYETFEKKYDSFKTPKQFAKLFEYTFQYKVELLKQLKIETNNLHLEIINAKIKDIEEILKDHGDLATFFHDDATAL